MENYGDSVAVYMNFLWLNCGHIMEVCMVEV